MFLMTWVAFVVALLVFLHASTDIAEAERLSYYVGSVIVAGLAAKLAVAARRATTT